ncbi:MAG: zf-HC2 domain-containing protein [Armatimonadota bacterium]
MECKKIESLISEYSVGLIKGRLKSEIEDHLAGCPSCSSELEKLDNVMLLIDDMESVEPPVGLWNGVYNRIIEPQRPLGTWDKIRIGLHRKTVGWSIGLATAAVAITMIISNTHQPATSDMYVSNDYIQGHVVYASTDLFADQAAINSVAAISYREGSDSFE